MSYLVTSPALLVSPERDFSLRAWRRPVRASLLIAIASTVLLVSGASGAQAMRYTRSPYPGQGTAPVLEAAISQTWPEHLHQQALNVAWCESRGRADARHGQYRGHFQMGRSEWKRFGNGDPYDPLENAAAAYRYYSYAGSWRPWECQP